MSEHLISLIVIVLNGEQSLPALFGSIRAQSFDHRQIELILVDSMSSDGTRKLMEDFAAEGGFNRAVVLENPGKILPCGWNVALDEAVGDLVIRLDAHSLLPEDFLEKNVRCIDEGHDVCGGKTGNFVRRKTPWTETVSMAEDSIFGGSVAAFRRKETAGPVETLAFGCYKRSVLDDAGPFNELLVRTEDNDMNYRIRRAGYALYYTPEIESVRETRPTFRGLLQQKYKNGYWVGMTLGVDPRCFSLYHFVPLAFVLGILVTAALALLGFPFPCRLFWVLYGAANLTVSAFGIASRKPFRAVYLLLPFLLLALHAAYGTGTLIGVLKMPFWVRRMRKEGRLIRY